MEHSVVWREGLFLRPQHLQQQDRYWHSLLQRYRQALFPHAIGVLRLEFSPAHLLAGHIQLTQLDVCLPQGHWCLAPQRDALPEALALTEECLEGELLYLSVADEHGHPMPINCITRSIPDVMSQHAMAADIELAQLRPRLLWQHQVKDIADALPVARIKRLHANGHIELDTEYLPCTMTLSGSKGLEVLLHGVLQLLRQKQRQLTTPEPRLLTAHHCAHRTLQLIWLSRNITRLNHLLTLGHSQPEAIFDYLLEQEAELCALAPSPAPCLDPVRYCHTEQDRCFKAVIARMVERLTPFGLDGLHPITVQSSGSGQYRATLQPADIATPYRLWLGLKANSGDPLASQLIQQQLKIAFPGTMPDLLTLQLPGLALRMVSAPPAGWPTDYLCIEIVLNEDQLRQLEQEQVLLIQLTGELPALTLQLWIQIL